MDSLIDTGAEISVLNRRVAPNSDLAASKVQLGGVAANSTLQVLGTLDLTIYIQGKEFQQRVTVVNNSFTDLILGRDFLGDNNALINFRDNEVELKGLKIPCQLRSVPIQRVDGTAALAGTIRLSPRTRAITAYRITSTTVKPGHTVLFSPRPVKGVIQSSSLSVVREDSTILVETSNLGFRKFRYRAGDLPGDVYLIDEPARISSAWVMEDTTKEIVAEISADTEPRPVAETPPNAEKLVAAVTEDKNVPPRDQRIKEVDLKHLNEADAEQVRTFLDRNIDIFSDGIRTGKTTRVTHSIDTGDALPISIPMYRKSPAENELIDKEVANMLAADVVEPGESPWSAPIVMVRKKDGSCRFCVDYRKLNEVTVKSKYPMPKVDELLDTLRGATYFTGLDLKSGFWQIPLDMDARMKSAFRTRRGQFRFKVMPFGLVNAPATFQRLMDLILSGIAPEYALVYIDDIIIFTKGNLTDHLAHVNKVFAVLRKAGMQVSLPKCQFATFSLKYLGHVVSRDGVRVDPDKISAINRIAPPTTVKEVRSFLGMCGYYRRFIVNYAKITDPIQRLTRKNEPFVWTERRQAAFDQLKSKLSSAPVLAYPDWNQEFVIETDASFQAVAATLAQYDETHMLRPILYLSRSLTDPERSYSAAELEALAVVYAVDKLRPYIWGHHFTVVSDSSALRWLKQTKTTNHSRLAHWALALQEFDYSVIHRPGLSNKVCDALTRLRQIQPGTDAELWPQVLKMLDTVNDGEDLLDRHALTPSIKGPFLPSVIVAAVHPVVLEHEREAVAVGAGLDLRTEQRRDPTLLRFIDVLEGREPQGTPNQILEAHRRKDQFALMGGLLVYFTTPIKFPARSNQARICIPSTVRRKLLDSYHDQAGHPDKYRTFNALSPKYWWPNMFLDVKVWTQHCDTCQRFHRKAQRVPQRPIIPAAPNDIVAIDFWGPAKPTQRGNVFGMVMIDLFTKAVEAVPLMKDDSISAMRAIETAWIPHHSCPRHILSDRGQSFISSLAQSFYDAWGINKVTTTAWHPQGNGDAETAVKFVKDVLKALMYRSPKDWDELLPLVTLDINTRLNRTTGFSPFFLEHGRDPVLPIDTALLPEFKAKTHNDYAADLLARRMYVFRLVSEAFRKREKEFQAKNATIPPADTYEVGDQVWLHIDPVPESSQPKWEGPYRVIEVLSDLTYRLDISTGAYPVVHAQRLKRYHDPLYRITKPQEAPMVNPKLDRTTTVDLAKQVTKSTDAPDIYEVEAILDEGLLDDGTRTFFVKWKGYAKKFNSWVRELNLNSSDLLAQWRAKHPASELIAPPTSRKRTRSLSPKDRGPQRNRRRVITLYISREDATRT